MSSYAMSCFKLPAFLCKQIQSLLTCFWWDANPKTRKMCWVAWTTLTKPKYAGGLGFRDIETFNDALLAKIGWRLIKDPSSLVAQVLLGKYAKNSSFLDCVPPSTASHGWRSILSGRDLLKQGLGWVVGNGEKINIWGDAWLSCLSPESPIGPPPQDAASLKVSSLLCPISNTWNIDAIRHHLSQYEEKILKIITSSSPVDDAMVWTPDRTGSYTTKTGYGAACNSENRPNSLPPSFDWLKHLWNLKTSPKIKDFLWKVINRAIPISSNLASRGVPPFPCKRCKGVEDDLHAFVTCPYAMEVWENAPLLWIPGSQCVSLASLLLNGSSIITLPPIGLSVPLWPWLLWHLWKSRNNLCFDNRPFSALQVIHKAITDAREWQMAQGVGAPPRAQNLQLNAPTRTLPVATSRPSCFVDAAWNYNTGACGIAGVFKGPISPRLPDIRYSCRFISSALMAEAIAIRSAVMTAASSNLRSLTVLSDSQVMISMIKAKETRPALYGILFDIFYFSSLFDSISFVFIPRLANLEADLVAKSVLATVIDLSGDGD